MSGMALSLEQLLNLVGELNDQAGSDTPRDRFRRFLDTSITSVGIVRDYVDVCLSHSGQQYNRALQDLVNHAGRLMGFDVEFGRYAGVTNDIGHDGLWKADHFAIVVEVKTTDTFAVRTSTLLGYINALIDVGKIANAESALGLYVYGRPDASLEQLEGAIVHGGYDRRLRIATVDDILSLTELVQEGLLTRDEALSLLRPARVRVSSTVKILQRLASTTPVPSNGSVGSFEEPLREERRASTVPDSVVPEETTVQRQTPEPQRQFLLTPVADEPDASAEETIRALLDHGVYVFGERTTGRGQLKPGDMLAIYQSGKGVVAAAEVASTPEKKKSPYAKHAERFPWEFKVTNVRYFFDSPVVIDVNLRGQLDVFRGRYPAGPWAWLVQGTRRITEHDFRILTRS